MGCPLKIHEMLALLIFSNNDFYENLCSNDLGLKESVLGDYVLNGEPDFDSQKSHIDTSTYLQFREQGQFKNHQSKWIVLPLVQRNALLKLAFCDPRPKPDILYHAMSASQISVNSVR